MTGQTDQLSLYRCHKTVRAGKIAIVGHRVLDGGINCSGAYLAFCDHPDPGYPTLPAVDVSAEFVERHNPQVGGYLVQYEDGYQSYSPAQAFEAGYSLAPPKMDFGHALLMLKHGEKVAREGWNGKGLWLELQTPDAHSKMTLPYVFLCYPDDAKTTPGARVPWEPSQTDMLAEDWEIVQ